MNYLLKKVEFTPPPAAQEGVPTPLDSTGNEAPFPPVGIIVLAQYVEDGKTIMLTIPASTQLKVLISPDDVELTQDGMSAQYKFISFDANGVQDL